MHVEDMEEAVRRLVDHGILYTKFLVPGTGKFQCFFYGEWWLVIILDKERKQLERLKKVGIPKMVVQYQRSLRHPTALVVVVLLLLTLPDPDGNGIELGNYSGLPSNPIPKEEL